MVVCYEIHAYRMHVVCGQNAGVVVLDVMVSSVTTGHKGLNCIIGTS